MAIAILGEACLLLGRTDDAERLASRALDVARTRNELGDQAWLMRLLGRIASDRDPPELAQAQTHYRAALGLASRLGMGPLLAHCHLGLGTLYSRTGKRPEAQEHLTTATATYREMEMRFWLEQAETEMKELG
jgi:tetratricopeptide (TPR) repeat protein